MLEVSHTLESSASNIISGYSKFKLLSEKLFIIALDISYFSSSVITLS